MTEDQDLDILRILATRTPTEPTRLHYWVFGGPWRYGAGARGEPTGGEDVSIMG